MKAFLLTFTICILSLQIFAQLGEPPYIKSIFFGGGNYYIDVQQKQELNDWLDGFPGLEGYDIIINSHTDDIGSHEYNDWLSRMRTDSILRVLAERGIRPETVSREDFGELNPDFDNSTWEGKLQNRRADVFLVPPNS